MIEMVREWIFSIVLLVLAISFFEGIYPAGTTGDFLKYIFGLILLCVVLSPVKWLFG